MLNVWKSAKNRCPALGRVKSGLGLWLGIGLLLTLGLAACGDSPTATPTATATPPPSALEIAQGSATKLTDANSLHFTVTVKQGKVPIITGVDFKNADGDYQKPDKFNADLKVTAVGAQVNAKTVGINNKEWIVITGLQPTWKLLPDGVGFNAAVLFDGQKGLGATVQKAKDLKLVGSDTVDGTDCWHLQGTVSGPDIAPLIPIGLGKNDVTFDLWTGKQDMLTRKVTLVEITQDPNGSSWELHFSKFGDPVTVTPPPTSIGQGNQG